MHLIWNLTPDSSDRRCSTLETRGEANAIGNLFVVDKHIAFNTARILVVRGQPPGRTAGNIGAISVQAASVSFALVIGISDIATGLSWEHSSAAGSHTWLNSLCRCRNGRFLHPSRACPQSVS